MLEEARSAPEVIARQLSLDDELYRSLGAALRASPPNAIATIARGSSEHAARYLGYLLSTRTGLLAAPLPMSLVTLHRTALRGECLLSLAISQSGQSPDLLEPLRQLGASGATTVALVNDEGSPLARSARWFLPLRAGPELAVPATKSFLASLSAGIRLAGNWTEDLSLLEALKALPQALSAALAQDWSRAVEALQGATGAFVISRGLGLPAAQEVALKLKEACGIQGEAFSAAEVRHGPLSLVAPGFPVLVLAVRGPGQAELLELALDLKNRGARVLLFAPPDVPGRDLTIIPAAAPELDPATLVASAYPFAEALGRARGRDPDRPPNLTKIMTTR